MNNANIWSAISAELRRDVLSAEAIAKLEKAFEEEEQREQSTHEHSTLLFERAA